MCKDILINFTSYYRCPYRMELARKVLLESKFIRYSHFENENQKQKNKSRLQVRMDSGNELEREGENNFFLLFIFSLFLSQIYENRTVGFYRS